LHLNSKGKKQSAKKIVNTLKDILNKKELDPITMKWTEKHVMDREKNHISLVNINQSYEKKKIESRKDKRLDIKDKKIKKKKKMWTGTE
jgi:hypothetical protein